MRVLYIAHNHPSVRPGGAEQHALELHRAMGRVAGVETFLLAKGGPPVGRIGRLHEGTFVAPVAGSSSEYFLFTDGYNFDYLNGTIGEKVFYTKHFRAFLTAIQPDVVHFQHTLFLGYDMIREVHHTLPHVPIVYTLHEYLPICARDGQMIRTADNELCETESPSRCNQCFPTWSPQTFFMRKRLIQGHLELVDQFLAPSHFLRQRFVEWGIPAAKIRFMDYGRRPVKAPPNCASRRHTRLGYFGQLSPYKGIDVLIEAMRILESRSSASATTQEPRTHSVRRADDASTIESRSTEAVTLKLHGANLDLQEGAFRRKLSELLDQTQRTVKLVGKYAQDQLPELMGEIDWVVVPSVWWENSPLVIQEAFLHRRPVICSDVGGMAEKVTDGVNGIHFRVGDAGSLARAIERATASPSTWEQMRAGIPAIYGLDTQVEDLLGLYQNLLDRGREVVMADAAAE